MLWVKKPTSVQIDEKSKRSGQKTLFSRSGYSTDDLVSRSDTESTE